MAGAVVPVQQVYDLGAAWYRGRRSLDWKPLAPEAKVRIFREVGLTGDYWTLE